jgi:superfamily I DNA/RNA helicase/RecB family exonuclease
VSVAEVHIEPDEWDAAIAEPDGPQLVVGGPGSGKTEFLVRRAQHLVDTGVSPDEILLLSFSRRGAGDLRRRVEDRLDRSLTGIPAFTFHSLALRIIEAHGAHGDWTTAPTPLTGPEQVSLVAAVLAGEDPDDWPLPYRRLLPTRSFATEVTDFCLRAAERLIGPDDIEAMGRADWRGIPGFMRRYHRALVARGRIDYGTLQAEAVALLGDERVSDSMTTSFRYVLVDEYQDTTVAQAAMLERLVAGHGNLIVAGDPYQSVYSFRGAEVSNVADFPSRFSSPAGPQPRRIVLTASLRVPSRILEAAVRVTSGAGLPGSSGPMRPAPGEGTVETYRFDQQSHEAEWIASEIHRMHLLGHVPYRHVAVLVRSKRGLLTELSRALQRRGIPHDAPDSRLVEHPSIRPVVDLVTAATAGGAERSAAIRRILLGSLVGITLSAARDMERRFLRGDGWPEILADGGPALTEIAALLHDRAWATDMPASEGFWHLWTTVGGFAAQVATPTAAGGRAALASFGQALDRLGERDPTATLADYIEAASSEDFEAEPLLEPAESDGVTLTTLHQAKGLEFDVVFIADAREGVLPDLRTRDSILGARNLSPHNAGDDAAYARFRLQEETRLVYTAMCRARIRVVWTCTSAVGDDEGPPSRFLPLVAGTSMELATRPPERRDEPTTPFEAESWLRRILRDPARPSADRLAALAALTTGMRWQPRPASAFAGVLERGPDRGVLGHTHTLSPSQAESYATCPRRYVLEGPLSVGRQHSPYMEIGSLIHAVLERVETEAAGSGREHGSIDEALAALDEAFDPVAFGGDPWASAWMERAARILRHLYENWPGHGPAIGLERRVSRRIDGVEWRGRVDRLEQRPDGVHVVDYKTGARAATVAEAAGSMQLGFYAGAIADLQVSGAEFWFPAARGASTVVRRFDMDRLPDVEAAMRTVQKGILAEEWAPTPGPDCDRCSVRNVCPMWPEGAEAYSS